MYILSCFLLKFAYTYIHVHVCVYIGFLVEPKVIVNLVRNVEFIIYVDPTALT